MDQSFNKNRVSEVSSILGEKGNHPENSITGLPSPPSKPYDSIDFSNLKKSPSPSLKSKSKTLPNSYERPVTPVLKPISTPSQEQNVEVNSSLPIEVKSLSQASKSFKLSVDLKTISLNNPGTIYSNAMLAYKYLALHKECITTPSFILRG